MGRVFLLLSLIVLVLTGCDWVPNRDNPVDPRSPYYEAPPKPNEPPRIDTLFIVTDCQGVSFPFCSFEVVCRVSDPDNNVLPHSVVARVEVLDGVDSVWRMADDPFRGGFILRKSQFDLPDRSILRLVERRRPVTVTVRDDSGATASATTHFTMLQTAWPRPLYPGGDGGVDTVYEAHPQLGWAPWQQQGGGAHRFSVRVSFMNLYNVWEINGLMPTDTFVVVEDTLLDSSVHSGIFYSWFLTVTDEFGNRATAEALSFRYFDTTRFAICNPEIEVAHD